jgi:adenylate kinase family enzyme
MQRVLVHQLIADPCWVMDGNYGGTLDVRLATCDTVVFLDVPRVMCLWRVLRRRLKFYRAARPDVAPGCPERLTWQFVSWVWTYPARRRPGILRRLAGLRPDQRAIVLSSKRSVRRFLEGLPALGD